MIRAYLIGGDAIVLALAQACFPELWWRAVDNASRPKQGGALRRTAVGKAWNEDLKEFDIVAVWAGGGNIAPALSEEITARQFALEAAPFHGDDPAVSIQAKVLRLRPFFGAVAPELGTSGLEGLLLRTGAGARSGVVVVGRPSLLEIAFERFTYSTIHAVLCPEPTNDELFAATEGGALLAEPSEIAVLLAASEWVVTDVVEIALAATVAGARVITPAAIESEVAWFGEPSAHGSFDTASYYGLAEQDGRGSASADDVVQNWRLAVGARRRAFLAAQDYSIELVSLCFPSLDWRELTSSCTSTSADWIVSSAGQSIEGCEGRRFVFDKSPFAVEPKLPSHLICMRLRPLDGDRVAELEAAAGLPPLALPSESREGVFVYGDPAIVRTARACFPDATLRVSLRRSAFPDAMALGQLRATLVPLNELLHDLPQAETVVSDSPAIIMAALSVGARAQGEGEAQEWSSRVVSSVNDRVDAAGYYGFADIKARSHVSAERAIEAWRERLIASPAVLTSPPAFEAIRHVMIGQPGRAVVPFTRHLGEAAWQKPGDVRRSDLEENHAHLSGHDITIYARQPDVPAWMRAVGRAHWLVDRTPIDYPLVLTTAAAFVPAFHRHRVRLDGDFVIYVPEDEIAEWSAETREEYRFFGSKIRPRLARLQTARRLARYNKVEMGRRYGPLGAERVLVLGHETENPDYLVTNPEMTKDADVIRLALLERPNSRILYLPQKEALANAAEMAVIHALGDRVQIIDQDIGLSEFAHVVCEVRTVDSLIGLMALAVGLPLVVHGRPAYAGLGLTRDLDASGSSLAPRVSEPLDLDAFLGWQFRDGVLFADTLDGTPMDVESFINLWTPFLGELGDEVADRIVALACNPAQNAADRSRFIRALAAHAKDDHLTTVIERIGGAEAVKAHLDLASEIALVVARRGNWRDAVHRVRAMWPVHNTPSHQKMFDLLVSIRRTLSSTRDTKTFSAYVLSSFRNMTSAELKKLGDCFAKSFFFGAAMTMYTSCESSKEVRTAKFYCQIAIGNIEAAQKEIDSLQAMKVPVEELEIALEQRRGNTDTVLQRLEDMAKNAPTNTDLQLRLAGAYREAGYLDKASDVFLRLLRTKHGLAAGRFLGIIGVAQMDTSTSAGFILEQLHRLPTDVVAMRALADIYSFDNNLLKAGDALLEVLKLSPLNIGAHTQLIELEKEIALDASDDSNSWTGAYDLFLGDIDQHSAETLMAQGRSRLQQHDFETLKRNCCTIMRLFPADVSAYAWHAHALAWEPGDKSPETIGLIRSYYDCSIAREREDNSWMILDSIRSVSYLGDIKSVSQMVRENHFSLYTGDREKFVIPRYSAALARGDFLEAYEAMRLFARTRAMRRNAHHFHLALSLEEIEPHQKKLLTSEGGPGDELRYSLLYPEIVQRLGDVTITVDKRFITLFERSYPMVKRFVSLPRYHAKRLNEALLDDIDQLPDRDLAPYFNNETWRIACESDVVAPIACLLADFRKTDADFARAHNVRLKPDPDLVATWHQRLAPYRDRLIVGATWTSMMRQYQRIGNYLDHGEMGPLFQTPGTIFVNCQYEPVDEELRWVRDTLGVEILDFPDLNKRDDFEGLAGLLSNLDIFIGTGTTTTEFAALLGCPTIFASPASMNAYRNPDHTEQDRYYSNVALVRPIPATDRAAMMHRIGFLLREAVEKKAQGCLNASCIASALKATDTRAAPEQVTTLSTGHVPQRGVA